MRIKSIEITNFRGLIAERIEFTDAMTVLVGPNGGGKSSVLEAISIMLSWLPVGLSNKGARSMKIRPRDVTVGKPFSCLKMILGRRHSDDIILALVRGKPPADCGALTDMSGAKKYGDDMRVLLDAAKGCNVEIPLFAYYGADRTSSGYSAPRPCYGCDRTSVYARAFDAGTDFRKFSRWFVDAIKDRARGIEEASLLPLKAANRLRDSVNRKYSAVYTVKRALAEFSEIFAGFEVRGGELFLSSKNIYADSLSAGEKTVVALIADIAMRMAVANPNKKNPLDTSAIVLIDELDLHLHPDWQTAVAEKLPRIFTNAQFIISSHSPSIMAVSKSLYRLAQGESGGRFEEVESPFGRNPSDLLASVLHGAREPATARKFAAMYAALDRGDAEAASKIIDELNSQIPDDPEVARAEYLVRALHPKSSR